jgi:hypothetical protein
MQTLVERGCGLDVHQATVVACLLTVQKDGRVQKQMRTFATTTRELVGLRDWLLAEGCTHLAMESTGVYWKPVYAVLEGELEIVIANAQHVKKVPGRKTDVKDAEWLADLLCHGLLRPSFVPPKAIRELRDLTRYPRKLVQSQAAERNRLLKLLESANIKLASVATDVFGVSGRLMLRALIGKAGVYFYSQPFAGVGVHHAQHPDRPSRSQHIMRKMQRPFLVGCRVLSQRRTYTRAMLALLVSQAQPRLAIDSVHPLVVRPLAFPSQQHA